MINGIQIYRPDEAIDAILPVKAGAQISTGEIVMAEDANGYAIPAKTGSQGDDAFMGIATEEVDNTDGADGDVNITIKIPKILKAPCILTSITAMGTPAYPNSPRRVTAGGTPPPNAQIGKIIGIEHGTHLIIAVKQGG